MRALLPPPSVCMYPCTAKNNSIFLHQGYLSIAEEHGISPEWPQATRHRHLQLLLKQMSEGWQGWSGGLRPGPVLHGGPATHPAQWSLTASATYWDPPLFSQTLAEKKLVDSGNSTKATNVPTNIIFDFISPFLGISPAVYLDMCTIRIQIFIHCRMNYNSRWQETTQMTGMEEDSQASLWWNIIQS